MEVSSSSLFINIRADPELTPEKRTGGSAGTGGEAAKAPRLTYFTRPWQHVSAVLVKFMNE